MVDLNTNVSLKYSQILKNLKPLQPPEFPRYRVRCQTGLTNRWRQPQSLYSDMLGSSQALKAINLPFNQNLVNTFKYTYPSMNPMLLTCQEFADINEKNWSLLRRQRAHKAAPEEEEEEHVPA